MRRGALPKVLPLLGKRKRQISIETLLKSGSSVSPILTLHPSIEERPPRLEAAIARVRGVRRASISFLVAAEGLVPFWGLILDPECPCSCLVFAWAQGRRAGRTCSVIQR